MKAISSKRKKSDEDHEALAELEFAGGIYLTDDDKVGIPAWNISIHCKTARVNKLGKAVERGVLPIGADVLPISHDGPDTPQAMWQAGCFDQRSVKVGQARVTRTRPSFRNWSVTATFVVDAEIIDMDDFVRARGECGCPVRARLCQPAPFRPLRGRGS